MKKVRAYLFTVEETEEILQDLLDDKTLKLTRNTFFYEANSETQFLDGGQIDERFEQYLYNNLHELEVFEKCEHYVTEDGLVVIVELE